MRAAGMSLKYLTMAAAGGGLAFSLALLTLSEIVLEPAETVARAARGDFSANDGIWLQNKDSYFHAKQLKANGNMSDITIYRPTEDQLMVLRASAAIRQGNSWKLINGNMTTLNRGDNSFTAPSMQHRTFVSRGWDFPAAATAAALKAVARRPREMSMRSLLIAVTLEKNSGGTQFIGALWKRLWSLPAPLLLAASGVWFVGHTRRRRILATALAATGMVGAYYFSAILCAQLATLLRLPLINALPTLLLIGIIFVGARRRFA
jgi:lipopolysaccharide export LptBFGC system permease protein LptF